MSMSVIAPRRLSLLPLASTGSTPVSTALAAVRSQAAFLRSLLDEVERLAPMSPVHESFGDQIIEELARLGRRSLEAASELTRVVAAARCCA